MVLFIVLDCSSNSELLTNRSVSHLFFLLNPPHCRRAVSFNPPSPAVFDLQPATRLQIAQLRERPSGSSICSLRGAASISPLLTFNQLQLWVSLTRVALAVGHPITPLKLSAPCARPTGGSCLQGLHE